MAQEPESVNHPEGSARVWANPKARMALFGAFGCIVLMLIWRIVAPPGKEQKVKSQVENDLEKIIDNSKKDGNGDKDRPTNIQKKAADQPVGDPEAVAVLNTVDARNAAAAKRKADAEDQAMAQLAFQNYSRRQQGLSYDPTLAAAWEVRMAKAAADGQVLAAPAEISLENLEELKKSNPELYAKWVTLQGGAIKAGSKGPQMASAPGAAQKGGASVLAPGTIPPGIDPKTGLPTGAIGATGAGTVGSNVGLPADFAYALADDGTPDIANGAIPIQISYTPPGSSQPVNITKWVRPGYLTGRVRPVDPRAAIEEDEAFRRAMKDTTDIPVDTQHAPAGIPYRYTNAKVRVGGGDFTFANRYVVVLPNPKGKLTPPNPPVPGRAPATGTPAPAASGGRK